MSLTEHYERPAQKQKRVDQHILDDRAFITQARDKSDSKTDKTNRRGFQKHSIYTKSMRLVFYFGFVAEVWVIRKLPRVVLQGARQGRPFIPSSRLRCRRRCCVAAVPGRGL